VNLHPFNTETLGTLKLRRVRQWDDPPCEYPWTIGYRVPIGLDTEGSVVRSAVCVSGVLESASWLRTFRLVIRRSREPPASSNEEASGTSDASGGATEGQSSIRTSSTTAFSTSSSFYQPSDLLLDLLLLFAHS